jgi:hypothetical protein
MKLMEIEGFSFGLFSKPIFKNIRVLYIGGNKIETIQEKFDLPYLELLNLEKNNIKSLSFLGNCKNLREVFVAKNRIKTMTNLVNLKELILLDMSGNCIENFDDLAILSFNSKLRNLNLRGNPIESKKDFKGNLKKLFPMLKDGTLFFEKNSKYLKYSEIAFNQTMMMDNKFSGSKI